MKEVYTNRPAPVIPGLPSTNLTTLDYASADKFVGYSISEDCLAGCKAMMDNFGIHSYGSSDRVYQLMHEINGTLQYAGANPFSNYVDAVNCINSHLDSGRPIIVGVNNKIVHNTSEFHNRDGTDHFVLITGRGVDNYGPYFSYMDPGLNNALDGCNSLTNRLYYNVANQTFYDPFDNINRVVDVVHVRPNDGKRWDRTTLMH